MVSYRVIGTSTPRVDGVDKVTGKALYSADFPLTGVLWGKVLHSPHAHARIVSIDTSAARALPGVVAVITGQADYLAWSDYGFNSLSEVMVANTAFLQKSADAVRRFVAATQRGWTESRDNPDAAVDAQIKLNPNNFSREIISAALAGTLKNVDGPNTQGRPWGEMTLTAILSSCSSIARPWEKRSSPDLTMP